jgi:hypothetical protein
MMARAEGEGTLYVPNVELVGPVDHVSVCMEPSLDGLEEAETKANLEDGARNTIGGCSPPSCTWPSDATSWTLGSGYHITDLSKDG